MDLKTYEEIKFELAELIRAGQFSATDGEKDSNKRYDAERPWRDLLTRLAEDRFTVVVAGRFSRGKSSLMKHRARLMLRESLTPVFAKPKVSVWERWKGMNPWLAAKR